MASPGRSESRSRWPICRSSSSPASCPRWSLTRLKRSKSRNRTAKVSPPVRPRSIASPMRPTIRARLGRPVRRSVAAERRRSPRHALGERRGPAEHVPLRAQEQRHQERHGQPTAGGRRRGPRRGVPEPRPRPGGDLPAVAADGHLGQQQAAAGAAGGRPPGRQAGLEDRFPLRRLGGAAVPHREEQLVIDPAADVREDEIGPQRRDDPAAERRPTLGRCAARQRGVQVREEQEERGRRELARAEVDEPADRHVVPLHRPQRGRPAVRLPGEVQAEDPVAGVRRLRELHQHPRRARRVGCRRVVAQAERRGLVGAGLLDEGGHRRVPDRLRVTHPRERGEVLGHRLGGHRAAEALAGHPVGAGEDPPQRPHLDAVGVDAAAHLRLQPLGQPLVPGGVGPELGLVEPGRRRGGQQHHRRDRERAEPAADAPGRGGETLRRAEKEGIVHRRIGEGDGRPRTRAGGHRPRKPASLRFSSRRRPGCNGQARGLRATAAWGPLTRGIGTTGAAGSPSGQADPRPAATASRPGSRRRRTASTRPRRRTTPHASRRTLGTPPSAEAWRTSPPSAATTT